MRYLPRRLSNPLCHSRSSPEGRASDHCQFCLSWDEPAQGSAIANAYCTLVHALTGRTLLKKMFPDKTSCNVRVKSDEDCLIRAQARALARNREMITADQAEPFA